MRPTWGPSGADRTQVGPMLAPWTLLSGMLQIHYDASNIEFDIFTERYKVFDGFENYIVV